MNEPENKARRELDGLVAEYLDLKRRDPAIDVRSFVARHPEQARELLDVLRGMEWMEEAAEAFSAEAPGRAPETGAAGAASGSCADDFVARVLAEIAGHAGGRRYTPEGEIARGGQGAVLAVWDPSLRRRLAMKVALAQGELEAPERMADSRSLARFLEEAHVTAQLDHPGIVPVHELGLDAERRVYFTMKLVRGRDLAAVLELVKTGAEGWSLTRALSVLLRVCEAMAYAHAKGVVHRDLKPSNVMVGKYGEVYVMDWGLARVRGVEDRKDVRIRSELTTELCSRRRESEPADDSPLVTMDGDVVGTPAYMPPEQARGELAAIGPHSDVYALGAILYQLLTGRMPYAAPGGRLSHRAVWALVQGRAPEPVAALAPRAPAELVAICEKAMAREIAARYPEMGELSEDLRAYLERRVVRAYETGAVAELRKWITRNRGVAASLGAAAVATVLGLAGVGYVEAEGRRAADMERDRTRLERDNVLRLSAFQELAELERQADELWPPTPDLEQAYRDWLARARRLVAGLEPDPAGTDLGHRARLAEIEDRALPWTEAEREADRRSHPRFAELASLRARLAALDRADAVRAGKRQVEEVAVDPASLPGLQALEHWWNWVIGGNAFPDERARARAAVEAVRRGELDATGCEPVLNVLAWERIDPDSGLPAEFATGLALARLGVEANPHAGALDTLAWACFANGLDDEALEASRAALEAASPGHQAILRGQLERLGEEIEAARSGATRTRMLREIEELEADLGLRRTWRFAREEDRWVRAQLVELVAALEALADPSRGRIAGESAEHGLGIERRLALLESLAQRSVLNQEPQRLWDEAIASIANRQECPAYSGLLIEPQFGLLPLGRDPESGLWEFAHLQSGEPPARGPDGRFVVTEATGLVLVLLQGGTFAMGSQSADPGGSNFDPAGTGDMGPVHAVTLSPFLISKYEVTQGQWLRTLGSNPSLAGPQRWELARNRPGGKADLTYPVEHVTWLHGMEFCRRLGLVLPSEARWEYAARAGTGSIFWTGDDIESLRGAANVADFHASRPDEPWQDIAQALDEGSTWHAPVASGLPNPFGLHHVHGNVAEWCLDAKDGLFYPRCLVEPRVDPVAEPSTPEPSIRIYRGGSFWEPARYARSACRLSTNLDAAHFALGLRPARELSWGATPLGGK